MATVTIKANNQGWTEIVPSAGAGLVTNNSTCRTIFRTNGSLPGVGVRSGHILNPDNSVNVDLSAGTDALYVRVVAEESTTRESLIAFTAV